MIQGKCPTCAKPFAINTLNDLPTFPFCTERCRLIDLGRWADGTHAIPGTPMPPAGTRPQESDDEDESY